MVHHLNVLVNDEQQDLLIAKESIPLIVKAVLELETQPSDEVCLHFVTEEEISRLHQQYFNDPSPTDCISFPIDGREEAEFHVLGEVFVCPKTAIKYCEERGGCPLEECTLYLVHGLLHLLDYDDLDDVDRAEMRAAEKRIMDSLKSRQLILEANP